MKKIEVTVVAPDASKVEEVLRSMELPYSVSPSKVGDQECVSYSILVPDQLSDKVVDEVSKRMDMRIKSNTITVYHVEAVISTCIDRLKEKAVKSNGPPSPLERLVEVTERYTHLNRDVTLMAIFATIVALAGLFLDNVVMLIGAMLLSPLLGPINAFAVHASLGKIKKLVKIEILILALLFTVIVISTLSTYMASMFFPLPITGQILSRSHASLIDIVIGLTLGLAGGLALFAALPEILIGVAVAVALVPPAVVTGIGLALMNLEIFLGALLLTLVYLLGLQLGSTLLLRVKGVSPRKYYKKAEAKRHSAYSIIILSILLLILIWLVITTNL
ncbi:TIGR00341 family protein [Candidatus Bathyarchaeota archaeon]|nr:TIGR00341 family protein [Candidatus Bathyarchaeota archaeon]